MGTEFAQALAYGQAGESAIAMWFRNKGYSVLPIYEKILDDNKGPRLFLPTETRVAPDLLVFKTGRALWIEAKHKTAFSWHRLTERWVTGIDIRHYNDYCVIDDSTPWPVWLLFLHRGGTAKDSPESPAGLFGNELSVLRQCENHRHENWGKSGMVYWAKDKLIRIADVADL
jgi:hypothetical protein